MKSLGPKTLIFPTPVWCVGTYDGAGKPNVMTIAWGGVCNSKPPSVTISLRKATYTYGCILERKAFTLSVPSEAHVAEADFFGIASGRDTDKWAASGLTPERSALVDAPYVKEFPMVLECRLVHHFDLGLHTHFVGEIMDVKVKESLLDENGKPHIDKVAPFVYSPDVSEYHAIGRYLGRGFSIGKGLVKG